MPNARCKPELDLIAKIGQLLSPTDKPMQVQVGVATGSAVVSREQVLGEPLAVAAGLSKAAAANSMLVAASTRKLLGGIFVFEYGATPDCRSFRCGERLPRRWGAEKLESRFKARQSDEIKAALRPQPRFAKAIGSVGSSQALRRPSCPHRRRAWHRKIAPLRSFYGPYCGRAARHHPIPMLSVP